MKRFFSLFFLAGFLFALDFVVKWYVHGNLSNSAWASPIYPYGGIGVFKDIFGITFSINYVKNTGAAWGIFSSHPIFLLSVRMLLIGGLLSYLLFFKKSRDKALPLTLIVTGALANIVDFFLYGHVVDMFRFQFGRYVFPVFNIADALITIGAALLIFQAIVDKVKSMQSA